MSDARQIRLARFLLRVRPASLGSFLKRLFKVGRVEFAHPVGKFWLDPASNFGSRLMEGEDYEPEMASAIRGYLRPGMTFVDLGANEGYFSVVAAGLVDGGQIVAIEPQSRLQPVLAKNFALNGVAGHVVQSAIGSEPGSAELNLFPDTNTGATSFGHPVSYSLPTETVTIRTLPELLESLGLSNVDLIKVDIEGFEHEALRGAEPWLANHQIKGLIIELHPPLLAELGTSVSAIQAYLEGHGYQWQMVGTDLALATTDS